MCLAEQAVTILVRPSPFLLGRLNTLRDTENAPLGRRGSDGVNTDESTRGLVRTHCASHTASDRQEPCGDTQVGHRCPALEILISVDTLTQQARRRDHCRVVALAGITSATSRWVFSHLSPGTRAFITAKGKALPPDSDAGGRRRRRPEALASRRGVASAHPAHMVFQLSMCSRMWPFES
ncbi:hypothetical protein BD413DRAFT_503857 [Trametes elegans]|nr:hypothetical protein BD413DRAFT_503857 [Trametes elegans]